MKMMWRKLSSKSADPSLIPPAGYQKKLLHSNSRHPHVAFVHGQISVGRRLPHMATSPTSRGLEHPAQPPASRPFSRHSQSNMRSNL